MKKTVIVDVVFVNNVMGNEGWERGESGEKVKGVKAKGWGSCCQTADQGGWEFVTTSKKLALQVSGDFLVFAGGFEEKLAVHCVNIKYVYVM
jgi:hypothetical protein